MYILFWDSPFDTSDRAVGERKQCSFIAEAGSVALDRWTAFDHTAATADRIRDNFGSAASARFLLSFIGKTESTVHAAGGHVFGFHFVHGSSSPKLS